ncbi:MAG: F-type H+-transporting ATPase subunit epsilon [Patescibacteria group bacterium]|nr:F-type H+-transporting ATPase subunit epsilon [Patescibacteria group bacterium]
MHFSLISITKKVLESSEVSSVTLPTKTGVITVLPEHEPIVSALTPGVLSVTVGNKNVLFAIGGGVLETDGKTVTVLADMVEEGGTVGMEDAEKRKTEAARLLKEARETGTTDMESLIALEEEYMKEEARVKLASGTI